MKNKQSSQMVATVWRHWSPVFKKHWFSLSVVVTSYLIGFYAELLKPKAWKEVFDSLLKNRHQLYILMTIVLQLRLIYHYNN